MTKATFLDRPGSGIIVIYSMFLFWILLGAAALNAPENMEVLGYTFATMAISGWMVMGKSPWKTTREYLEGIGEWYTILMIAIGSALMPITAIAHSSATAHVVGLTLIELLFLALSSVAIIGFAISTLWAWTTDKSYWIILPLRAAILLWIAAGAIRMVIAFCTCPC